MQLGWQTDSCDISTHGIHRLLCRHSEIDNISTDAYGENDRS
jgi:hypothetical protein